MSSFFNDNELKEIGFKLIGSNVLVSKKASIYGAQHISLGNNVRIDDFCCLVANENEIHIGSNVHIAFFSILMGSGGIVMEDFSGLSSRVSIYSATDDYSGMTLTNPTVPSKYKTIKAGKVILKKHVIIGSGTTILPNLTIGTGSSVGANSLVTKSLDEWGVYVGTPVRFLKDRMKDLLELEKKYLNELGNELD